MLILYRLAISFYSFLVLVISVTNRKAQKFKDGRKNWESRLSEDFKDQSEKVIWVHAASLGEFEQGRPIIEAIKASHKDAKLLLTFFSPSGYEVRKDYEHADWVHYLPLDSPKNARNFIDLVRPKLAIFIKYEFWYFYLKELTDRQIPVLMASCVFRNNQLFFHWSGSFFKPVFRKIDHYFVQDEESKRLISPISENVTISGDTRFDRVIEIAEKAQHFQVVDEFLPGKKCFMIGSSWASDIKVLVPFIKKYQDEFKFIIAPHNIGEEEIELIESLLSKTTRYSQPEDLTAARILIIDNIGMLSSLYRYADYAFIGGAYRGALHNTLEAAVFGIPVFFGVHENNSKFKEAMDLVECNAAFSVQDFESLDTLFTELNTNEKLYQEVSHAAHDYVRSRSGATRLIMEKVADLV